MNPCCAVLVVLSESSPRTARNHGRRIPPAAMGAEKREPVSPPCIDQRPSLNSETSPVAKSEPEARSRASVSVRVSAPNVNPLL
jgi:hypothetical protein